MSLYNTIAETYDAIRPGYPASLIADIVEAGNLSKTSWCRNSQSNNSLPFTRILH